MSEAQLIVITVIGVIVLFVSVGIYFKQKNELYKTEYKKLNENIGILKHTLQLEEEKNRALDDMIVELQQIIKTEGTKTKKVLSQKKSGEVRLGQIAEQLAPFLNGCPYDPKTMHFLGMPIDFLVFDYDAGEIVFLEVKSGGAKESERQKTIKNMIKEGRVYYEKMRINEKGVKVKRETNNE